MVVSQDAIRVVERYCQASGTLEGTVQVEEQVFRRDDNTELDAILVGCVAMCAVMVIR
jgi:hypothetical protein